MTVSINKDRGAVYDFVSNPANLPKWAKAFCLSIEEDGDSWRARTPQGEVTIKMAARNPYGVLDHTVVPAPGVEVHVPMRVVPNGKMCEVIFTLLRATDMTDERFDQDRAFVRRDLDSLKKVMEEN